MAFPFFAFMRDEANNEAKKSKVDLIVQDGQGSSPKQSSDLRNAVTQGVDGIVLVPNDVNALVPVVNEVIQSDIPLITVDRSVSVRRSPLHTWERITLLAGARKGNGYSKSFRMERRSSSCGANRGPVRRSTRAQGFYEVIKAGATNTKWSPTKPPTSLALKG